MVSLEPRQHKLQDPLAGRKKPTGGLVCVCAMASPTCTLHNNIWPSSVMASSEDLTSAESGSSWLPHRKAADGQLQRWGERMEGILLGDEATCQHTHQCPRDQDMGVFVISDWPEVADGHLCSTASVELGQALFRKQQPREPIRKRHHRFLGTARCRDMLRGNGTLVVLCR